MVALLPAEDPLRDRLMALWQFLLQPLATLVALGVRKNDCHADAFYTEADKAQRVAKY